MCKYAIHIGVSEKIFYNIDFIVKENGFKNRSQLVVFLLNFISELEPKEAKRIILEAQLEAAKKAVENFK